MSDLRVKRAAITLEGSAPPIWLPTDIGGCKRWGRSDLGITMDGSNRVSIFADQSGNGNDFTQATDAKKYIWTPNEINGHAALVGDGVDDEMRADTLCQFVYSLKPFTLFSVWRNVDVISWEYPSSWYCGTAGGMPDTLLFWLNANEIRIYRRLISNNYVGAAYTPGNWGYWILTFDGRYYNLRINGVPIIVNADFLDFDLGTGLDQFIIRSIKEKLHWAEDTFYDNAISAPNIALLESYAATRYTI